MKSSKNSINDDYEVEFTTLRDKYIELSENINNHAAQILIQMRKEWL